MTQNILPKQQRNSSGEKKVKGFNHQTLTLTIDWKKLQYAPSKASQKKTDVGGLLAWYSYWDMQPNIKGYLLYLHFS